MSGEDARYTRSGTHTRPGSVIGIVVSADPGETQVRYKNHKTRTFPYRLAGWNLLELPKFETLLGESRPAILARKGVENA